MDKKVMKEEAARRMRALKLYNAPGSSIIHAFTGDGILYASHPAMGNRAAELYPLTPAEKGIVKDFEEAYGGIVYHVIKNEMEFGIVIYSLLYVSAKETDWKTECRGFKDFSVTYTATPMAYLWNAGNTATEAGNLSSGSGSFGTITVTAGLGGLCRQG